MLQTQECTTQYSGPTAQRVRSAMDIADRLALFTVEKGRCLHHHDV